MSVEGKEHAVKFGRFLLKSCKDEFDEEGFLYWIFEGNTYDTQPLYEYWLENIYN